MKIHDFYGERPEFEMNGEKLGDYCHVLHEGMDEDGRPYGEEKNVSLTSFKPMPQLNPRIWKDEDTIRSDVRLRLLDIADDFIDTLEVDWTKTYDIILTGSLANYNWSEFSDFDLHIVVDFSEIDDRTEFVKDYFDSKKNDWNNKHDLMVKGYTVEVYVQDLNEEHDASGIYSLEKNEWVKKPEKDNIKAIKLDKFWIKEKALSFMDKIDSLEHDIETASTDSEKSEILARVEAFYDKVKKLRADSLKKHGEMAPGNIIYKILRRTNYLDKLMDLKTRAYDSEMSLQN